MCRRTQPDPRRHHATAVTIIQLRGEDQRAHTALVVVVRALQQGGGLAGVHRRIIEIELGHAPSVVLRTWRHSRYVPTQYGLPGRRSEEHTSELQSLIRISYAVFCLKKKKKNKKPKIKTHNKKVSH